MAGNEVLLDTNIVTAYFSADEKVLTRLGGIEAQLSVVTAGELLYGAYHSQRTDENIRRVRQFIAICTVLDCDETTAGYYGQIKHALRIKGRPIPENDIWIAAVAIQHDLRLVTRDAHFSEVAGLVTDIW